MALASDAGLYQDDSVHRKSRRRFSDGELLHRDAFVERVLGIEQEGERARRIDADLDRGDVAGLELVGDRGDRPLDRIEHPEPDGQVVGHQSAAPAPRPERADRGQRHQPRPQWKDRAVGREVVGGRAGRGRDQHAVADQLRKHHPAVDRNLDPGRLPSLAEQGDLVYGIVGQPLARDRHRLHVERRHREAPRRREPFLEAVEPPLVHQETHRAAVHPEHRQDAVALQHLVKGLEQEPVTAQRDHQVGLVGRDEGVKLAEHRFGRLGALRWGGDQRHCARSGAAPFFAPCLAHPPFARVMAAVRQGVPCRAAAAGPVGAHPPPG